MAGSFFFHGGPSAAGLTNAAMEVERIEFAAALGNGVDTEARNASQVAVPTITQSLGLQSRIQAALTFIEGTEQEIDLRMEFLHRMGLR
jgi:hypothetical protein